MPFLVDIVKPFKGRHNGLRGGWPVGQLQKMSKAILELDGHRLARTIAIIACSLIAEKRTTSMPLRYSRKPANYSYFDGYHHEPHLTYRKMIAAVDWLIENGYAEGHTGVWWLKKQSVIRATPKLMKFAHLVDISTRRGPKLKDEILLRDKDRNNVGFDDTDEIRQMRQRMKTINVHLASQRYFLDGVEIYVPPACRIFNQTFRRGGRIYHQGSSYQQMPKEQRAKIETLLDDGTVSPMVERDFTSLHVGLLYRRAGKRQPDGDLYSIEEYTRPLVKLATLVAINADGTEVGALTHILEGDDDLCRDNGVDRRDRYALRALVDRVLAAIRRKHYRIKEFFGSGAGAELMRADSDIAESVMLTMIARTGRCPLVVHDSFLVPVCDAEVLERVMAQALEQIAPAQGGGDGSSSRKANSLAATHQASTPHTHIHMGKQRIDQLVPATSGTQNNTLSTPHPDLLAGNGPPGSEDIPFDAEIEALVAGFDTTQALPTTSPALADATHRLTAEGQADR